MSWTKSWNKQIYENVFVVQESQSIQTVIDSCSSPATDNTYLVMIPPGLYDETLILPPYCNLFFCFGAKLVCSGATDQAISVQLGDSGCSSYIFNPQISAYTGIVASAVTNISRIFVFNPITETKHVAFAAGSPFQKHFIYNPIVDLINETDIQCNGFLARIGSEMTVFNPVITGSLSTVDFGYAMATQMSADSKIKVYNPQIKIDMTGTPNLKGLYCDTGSIEVSGGNVQTSGTNSVDVENSFGSVNAFGLNYTTSSGSIGGNSKVPGKLNVGGITEYADNAAALTAGLVAGDFYRTGDTSKVVH